MLPLRKNWIAKVAIVITLFAATLSFAVTETTTVSAADSINTLAPAAHKALVQAAVEEVLNGRNVAAVDSLFADNIIRTDSDRPNIAAGRKETAFLASYYRSAFPDLKYTVEDVIAEGDRVVTRWTATGTHLGWFRLYAPTGNQVAWSGVTIWQIRDGKIITIWIDQDMMGLTQQLGSKADIYLGPAYYR